MQPFLIFPWQYPFLSALKREIARRTGNHWGRTVIIIPHNRPRRYFLELFRQESGPVLLPRVLTVQELVAEYRAAGNEVQLRTAELPDRVSLLHRAVLAEARNNDGLRRKLGHMDMEHFLPWGIRLSGIMEECFSHCITARDLACTEHDVPSFAAAILSSLAGIQQRYMDALQDGGWSTPGLDVFTAASDAGTIPPLFQSSERRHVFIAGFAMLTEGENRLFRALWEQGAFICLHTDPRLSPDARIHWSAEDHRTWMRNWHARGELAGDREAAEGGAGESVEQKGGSIPSASGENLRTAEAAAGKKSEKDGGKISNPGKNSKKQTSSFPLLGEIPEQEKPAAAPDTRPEQGPHLHFCAGHDLHSQLLALQRDLAAQTAADMRDASLAAEDAENPSADTPEEPDGKTAASPARNEEQEKKSGMTQSPEEEASPGTEKLQNQGADTPMETGQEADGQEPANTAPSGPTTAIVLTGNQLLMPVLHHLPVKDVNISMGYPLNRSPLFTLINSLFLLARNSRTQETVFGKEADPGTAGKAVLSGSEDAAVFGDGDEDSAISGDEHENAALFRNEDSAIFRDGNGDSTVPGDGNGNPTAFRDENENSAVFGEGNEGPANFGDSDGMAFEDGDDNTAEKEGCSRAAACTGECHSGSESASEARYGKKDKAAPSRRYYWRTLLQCLCHPYLTMLSVTSDDGTKLSLREILRSAETAIRSGQRFVPLHDILEKTCADQPEAAAVLLRELEQTAFDGLASCGTTADVADCLQNLIALLLGYGGDIWERFPLDAECLYRLSQRILPQLRRSSLSRTPFSFSVLHLLTRELMEAERVPFELEPLGGMQVLGMLETRLLHFDRVFILDATDDALPGTAAQDPLLPDSLRTLLGLPHSRHRERIAAHTLYRLTASAREVYFYWQEGTSNLFDGRKIRSRFIEQYLWKEEQRLGRLLNPGESPLRRAACPIHAVTTHPRGLEVTPALKQSLRRLLSKPVSPTLLDSYLTCPFRFACQYLCGLRPIIEVNEGDDPARVGTFIHGVLYELFEPHLNTVLHPGDISQKDLEKAFSTALSASGLRAALPVDSFLMLKTAAPLRLSEFLKHQPAETRILELEKEHSVPFSVQGQSYTLTGVLDRLDVRDGHLHILDYKTGNTKEIDSGCWTDSSFWDLISAVSHGEEKPDAGNLEAFRERIPSVQLPCYMLLGETASSVPPGNAALVRLKEDGIELPLFDRDIDDETRKIAIDCRIPDLAGFLLLHMERAARFEPAEGPHCSYCNFRTLCLL